MALCTPALFEAPVASTMISCASRIVPKPMDSACVGTSSTLSKNRAYESPISYSSALTLILLAILGGTSQTARALGVNKKDAHIRFPRLFVKRHDSRPTRKARTGFIERHMSIGSDPSEQQVDPAESGNEGFVSCAFELRIGVDPAQQVRLSRWDVDFGKDCAASDNKRQTNQESSGTVHRPSGIRHL